VSPFCRADACWARARPVATCAGPCGQVPHKRCQLGVTIPMILRRPRLPGPRWRAAGQCQKACAHWNLLCHNQGHEVWGGGGGLVARGDRHIDTPDMPAAAGAGRRQSRGAIAPRRRGVVARDQAAGQAGGESGTGQRMRAVQVRTPRWADTLRPQAARRAMRMAGSPFATCAGRAESCAFSAATCSFTLVATTALDRALTSTRDTIGQSFSPETLLPSYCRSLLHSCSLS